MYRLIVSLIKVEKVAVTILAEKPTQIVRKCIEKSVQMYQWVRSFKLDENMPILIKVPSGLQHQN